MLEKCGNCKGKGYVFIPELGVNVSCDICRGKGGFDVPSDKEICSECKGKGKIVVPTTLGIGIEANCENCFGTGFVDKV